MFASRQSARLPMGVKGRKPIWPAQGTMVNAHFLEQAEFRQQLRLEKKRTQRAGTSFILVLLEAPRLLRGRALAEVQDCIRDTDILGWYVQYLVVGIIFTESGLGDGPMLVDELKLRLKAALSAGDFNDLSFSVFVGAEPDAKDEVRIPQVSETV